MTKVAWPSITTSGGNLGDAEQEKIRKLINNFGSILDEQCSKNKINVFNFPLFKPFNLFAAETKTKLILIFSLAVGTANEKWMDLRDKDPEPTLSDLLGAVQQQLGLSNLSGIQFPLNMLEEDFEKQKPDLIKSSGSWIDTLIKQAERKQKIVRLNPVFHGRDFLIENDLCFILMPFEEPYDTIYKKYIKPTVEKKFRIKRSDNIFKSSEIIEDVWEYINKSQFIIADVTGKNPNVFYELGIAHTVGKEVIIITQNKDDVPFDLKHRRYFVYSYDKSGLEKLVTDLTNTMDEFSKKS